jgi:preprotein translocase subunit SecA
VQVRGRGALIVDEADLLLIDEARTPLVIARPASEDEGPDLPALARLVEGLQSDQGERVAAKIDVLKGLRPRSFDAAVVAAQLRRGAPRDPAVSALFAERPGLLRAADRADRELKGGDRWMLDDGLLFAVDERARTAYLTSDGQAWIEARTGPLFARPEQTAQTLAALHNLILAYALFQRDRDYLVRDGKVVLIEQATGRSAESRRYMRGLHAALEVKELGGVLEETETLAQISVQGLVRQYVRRAGMTGTALPAADEFQRMYEMPVEVIPRHRPDRRVNLPPRLYRTAAEVDTAVLAELMEAHTLGRPVLVGTSDVARSERLSARLAAAGLSHVVLNAREHAREAEIIAEAGREGAITIATAMAGRGTDIRLQPDLEARQIERAVAEVRRRVAAGPVHVACASARAAEMMRAAIEKDDTLRLVATRRRNSLTVLGPNVEGDEREPARLFVALGLTVLATEPGAGRRLDEQLRGRAGRQGDEGLTLLYASLEDETLRFYGDPGMRARALRSLRERPYLEGRAAERLIEDAQERAERLHSGQRQQLFKLDDVLEAQRRAFVRAYDTALAQTAIDAPVRAMIPTVAAGEAASRPAEVTALPAWLDSLTVRYGLAPDALIGGEIIGEELTSVLRDALADRYERLRGEWGERWRDVVRSVLLQTATEQWAAHVDALGDVQQQAPTLFSFLSAPVEISYAREANRRYAGFTWLIQAETLANLLTLPLPYERPLSLIRPTFASSSGTDSSADRA